MYNKEYRYNDFVSPPNEYGEVAFYWWVGEKLTKERLSWQLDKLIDSNICGLQINYCHTDQGGQIYGLPYQSDPKLFSEDWWELLNWFIDQCKKHDISVSLSDYTLGTAGQGFFMDEILNDNPNITGKLLAYKQVVLEPNDTYIIEDNQTLISVIAIDEHNKIQDITNCKHYECNQKCKIAEVSYQNKEFSLDPMHKDAGKELIRTFFEKFNEQFPGECGKALNFFFSDELNFNIRGNLWDDSFAQEFIARKGYDIKPYLLAIFEDIGDITAKIRLDYYDVIVQLEEEHFFKPVFDWHERHHMTYGCDHGGRGKDITEFGDYFRTMKYNQGPGNDQPHLEADIIKNKVNSSIAHLYNRPRTWLEGFYGSGWGTSSSDIAQAVFKNFAMGHNLLTLHGLYYTTYGGYWEWAPPCNHWRMPYWKNMKGFLTGTKRLSYLNTRGYHVADVCVLYPVAALEGGLDGQLAVDAAFSLGEFLYQQAVDFDFIDFESVERALIDRKQLCVSGESYQAIVVPSMKTIRFSTLQKLLQFKQAGGLVICLGELPIASDHAGCNDPELDHIVEQLFDKDNHVNSNQDTLTLLDETFVRDLKVLDSAEQAYILHRRLENADFYMIYGVGKNASCFFRAKGNCYLFDLWNASRTQLTDVTQVAEGSIVKMPLDKNEVQILCFTQEQLVCPPLEKAMLMRKIPLEGKWGFQAVPTLDNRYGDFSLPAFPGTIGIQMRQPFFNSKKSTAGFGTFFKKAGPFAGDQFLPQLEQAILNDTYDNYSDCEFSWRYGVEGDPGHQGYHGLKGVISDEFICLGKKTEQMTEYSYLPEENGTVYYLVTSVFAEQAMTAAILCGSIAPDKIWVNGQKISSGQVALRQGYNDVVLKFDCCGRTFVVFEKQNPVPFTQTVPLAMSWYQNPNILPYDAFKEAGKANTLSFEMPPATAKMTFRSLGEATLWVDGKLIAPASAEKSGAVTAYTYTFEKIVPSVQTAKLELLSPVGYYGTAILTDYIDFSCTTGELELGDWSKHHSLECYSGGAKYIKTIQIDEKAANQRFVLNLGDLVSSCEVSVNNQSVGEKVVPNWEFDISDYILPGENTIEVTVYSTLGNHYTTIPTRYNFSKKAGLIGPVTIDVLSVQQ